MQQISTQNNQQNCILEFQNVARKNTPKNHCEIPELVNYPHLHFFQYQASQGIELDFDVSPSLITNTNTNKTINTVILEFRNLKKLQADSGIPEFSDKAHDARIRPYDLRGASHRSLVVSALTALAIAEQERKTLLAFTLNFDDEFTRRAAASPLPFASFTLEKMTKAFKRHNVSAEVAFAVETAYPSPKNNYPEGTKLTHIHGFLLAAIDDTKTTKTTLKSLKQVRKALKSLNKTKQSQAFGNNTRAFNRTQLRFDNIFTMENYEKLLGWVSYSTKPNEYEAKEELKRFKETLRQIRSGTFRHEKPAQIIAISRNIRKQTAFVHNELKRIFSEQKQTTRENEMTKDERKLLENDETAIVQTAKKPSAKQPKPKSSPFVAVFAGEIKLQHYRGLTAQGTPKPQKIKLEIEQYLITALKDVGVSNVRAFIETNLDFQERARLIDDRDLSESFNDAARFAITQFLLTQPPVNLQEKRAARKKSAESLKPVDEFEFDDELVERALSAVSEDAKRHEVELVISPETPPDDDILNFDDLNFDAPPPDNALQDDFERLDLKSSELLKAERAAFATAANLEIDAGLLSLV